MNNHKRPSSLRGAHTPCHCEADEVSRSNVGVGHDIGTPRQVRARNPQMTKLKCQMPMLSSILEEVGTKPGVQMTDTSGFGIQASGVQPSSRSCHLGFPLRVRDIETYQATITDGPLTRSSIVIYWYLVRPELRYESCHREISPAIRLGEISWRPGCERQISQ